MRHLFLSLWALAAIHITAQAVEDTLRLFPSKRGIYVIAHRGAHQGIPENTLAAYQHAIELGCDFVEIDVRTTKDGRFVSMHNASVDNYVNGASGKVKDMTLEELKKLDLGAKFGANWKGTTIPTLEEILKLCKGKIGIYLDLKEAPVLPLVDLINKYGMKDQVVWYIEDYDPALDQLFQICPGCLSMPDAGSSENIDKVVLKYQNQIVATDLSQLNTNYTESANKNHLLIFCDDKVENQDEWGSMLSLGADGIQTDKPEELIKFLERKGFRVTIPELGN